MKKHYQLILCLLLLHLVSCQSDDFSVNFDSENNIEANGSLAGLISRANQNPTALDDFIDRSSSTKIEFPYQLSINSGEFIELTSAEDYQLVINELQNLGTNYSIQFQFPLEVSLVNYENLEVSTLENLENISSLEENSSEINCIEFVFPLQINSFTLANEVTESRSFSNKAQFYNYVKQLQNQNGFFEFSYPIEVNVESNLVTILNRSQLETAFTNLNASCFVPNLFEPNPVNNPFEEFILNETFIITSFTDDGEDETEEFENFEFTFLANGELSIINSETGLNFTGFWETATDDGELELILDFTDTIFGELDDDWLVNDFGNDQFTLQDGNDIFIFEKI